MFTKAQSGAYRLSTWFLLTAMKIALTCGENLTSVLLAGQHGSNYGRVDVIYNGVIGTVCSHKWNRKDAIVICRQLNLPTSYAQAVPDGLLGHGSGPIWIDNVQCNGTEKHLGLCTFAGFGNHKCNHRLDAGLLCQGTNVSLFLGGIHGTNYGRLQVMYGKKNSIGTVCDDGWDNNDAKVACRQLGHPTTQARAVYSAMFAAGTGPIWLSNVDCQGTELNIALCGHHTFKQFNCRHNKDAGVICGYDLDVRLVNNGFRSRAEGELQVKYKNNWMVVPYTSYSGHKETVVICRQLNFSAQYGKKFRTPDYAYGVKLVHSQVLSKLECDGTEGNVGHCKFTVENIPLMSSNYEHIVTAYIVCGSGTWDGYPIFVNVTTNNEVITVPVDHQVDFVCETSYSLPQRKLQWQTSSQVLRKAIITTSSELFTNMAYVTKSRITFNVSETDNGTTLRCASENLLDNEKAFSKTGILNIGDIETTTDEIQPVDTLILSPETIAISTLATVTGLFGVLLSYFVFNHFCRRPKGVYDIQPLTDSEPERRCNTTINMTASCPDIATENMHSRVISEHREPMTIPVERKYKEWVEIDKHGKPKLKTNCF